MSFETNRTDLKAQMDDLWSRVLKMHGDQLKRPVDYMDMQILVMAVCDLSHQIQELKR